MADVEFAHFGDGGDALHIMIVQAVTGVDLQSKSVAVGGRVSDFGKFFILRSARFLVGIVAGVDFHHRRPGFFRGVHLFAVWCDEEGNANPGLAEHAASMFHPRKLPHHVQAAFGGQLFAPLRHQAGVLRQNARGNGEHFLGHCHFQVHAGLQSLTQDFHIGVLNVAPILAQVQGDGIRAGGLRHQGGMHRAGIARAARLAHGGDMIDINAEINHNSCRSLSSCRVCRYSLPK